MYFALGSAEALPASAIIPAMIGEEALVPPTTIQSPPWYTATPVAGSATAEMSEAVRIPQCVSCCHDGLAIQPEPPDPAPCQAPSVQRRATVVGFFRFVARVELELGRVLAVLIELAEAAVLGGAPGRAVRLAVHGEVRLGGRVVVGVDDRDGPPGPAGGRQPVRRHEVGTCQALRGGLG